MSDSSDQGPVIFVGSHKDDPADPSTKQIGTLYQADGSPVPVFRDNLATAYAEAVGAVPLPPAPLPPGGLEPTYGSVAIDTAAGTRNVEVVVGYVFDQGPTDWNAAMAELYKAQVAAWNAHAAVQKDIVDVLLTQLKG